MEALVKVRAHFTTRAWQPLHIELRRLFVDDFAWSFENLQWDNTKQHVITVVLKRGQPISLLVDGEKAHLKPDSQNFKLAAKVAMGVCESEDGSVSIDELSRDRTIWNNRELAKSKVKQRLHTLDMRALKGTLVIGDRVQLDA